MSFSDRLIVMRAGHIEQDDAPERVYRQPATAFVASFLGRTNLIPGRAEDGLVQTASASEQGLQGDVERCEVAGLGHMALLSHPRVFAHLLRWIGGDAPVRPRKKPSTRR